MSLYMFKPVEWVTATVNSEVNYALWVTMSVPVYPWWKNLVFWGAVNSGRGSACVGQEIWDICLLSSHFCLKPKIVLKIAFKKQS